ncbi:hypothetical protein HPP92_010604 [Vanilla planifolia]|uniref:Uncharacterized protein n=1 Tax=Vanilla planifolia TaxID=51239 RepID=A0A835R6T6_VANPL|nr:hypothetical protein HPP92_010604 [Vanilla planifolia]
MRRKRRRGTRGDQGFGVCLDYDVPRYRRCGAEVFDETGGVPEVAGVGGRANKGVDCGVREKGMRYEVGVNLLKVGERETTFKEPTNWIEPTAGGCFDGDGDAVQIRSRGMIVDNQYDPFGRPRWQK